MTEDTQAEMTPEQLAKKEELDQTMNKIHQIIKDNNCAGIVQLILPTDNGYFGLNLCEFGTETVLSLDVDPETQTLGWAPKPLKDIQPEQFLTTYHLIKEFKKMMSCALKEINEIRDHLADISVAKMQNVATELLTNLVAVTKEENTKAPEPTTVH